MQKKISYIKTIWGIYAGLSIIAWLFKVNTGGNSKIGDLYYDLEINEILCVYGKAKDYDAIDSWFVVCKELSFDDHIYFGTAGQHYFDRYCSLVSYSVNV